LETFRKVFDVSIRIQLEALDIPSTSNDNSTQQNERNNSPLWPLDWLLDRILLSFRYNFRGSQPTNRIDKPEWVFAYVSNQITTHDAFLSLLTSYLLEAGFEYSAKVRLNA